MVSGRRARHLSIFSLPGHHNDQGLRGLPMRSSLFPICCHLLPHPSCGSPVLFACRKAGPVLVTRTHMQQVSERACYLATESAVHWVAFDLRKPQASRYVFSSSQALHTPLISRTSWRDPPHDSVMLPSTHLEVSAGCLHPATTPRRATQPPPGATAQSLRRVLSKVGTAGRSASRSLPFPSPLLLFYI